MTDSLKAKITSDMKDAMRAQEKQRLGTIRLLLAAIKQREVDERIVLTDADVLAIINKMIKQRRDSIEQFQQAGRNELAAIEQQEIEILQNYLPPQLSDAEIEAAVADAIKETGAESAKDMGKVMGILKTKLAGRVDMAIVSTKIKAKLSS